MPGKTPPDSAGTVIIGAGIVGCSTAYELAEAGASDILVIDQGELPKTGGSTLHAPGGVGQGGMDKTLVEFAKQSRDLYREFDAYTERGGLDIAFDEQELDFMRLIAEYCESWGVPAEILDPDEVAQENPHMETELLSGALFTPTMGQTKTVTLLERLHEAASDLGVSFLGRTEVTDLEVRGEEIRTVDTDRGRIEADRVLIAANIWSPLLGQMAGIEVPLVPCEHQFVLTESLPELEGQTHLQWDGGIRSRRGRMYAGPQGEGYGVGNYNHAPRVVDPVDIDAYDEAVEQPPVNEFYVGADGPEPESIRMPSSRPFTDDDFTAGWEHAVELFPFLADAEIKESFNGMFSFTPDGMPILGPSPEVDDLWLAAAVWVTHAGGVGKAMAEWMTEGAPSVNVSRCDVARFLPHERNRPYARQMGARAYSNVHEIDPMHPRSPLSAPRNVRTSPMHDHFEALGGEFTAAGGLERPLRFADNEAELERYGEQIPDRDGWNARYWSRIEGAEHLAVRDRVGVFDISGLSHIEVVGPAAEPALQRVLPTDVDIDPGGIRYTPMVDRRGGILGDITFVRTDADSYLLLANGGRAGQRQLAWLREQIPTDTDARVIDRRFDYCGLGVWGPRARDVLSDLVDIDLSSDAFPYYSAQECHVGVVPVTAVRVSYVGELGWELHTRSEYGSKLFEEVWPAVEAADGVAAGDGALNSLRLEKGYPLFDADINGEVDPFEAGLDFAVDFDSGDFIGRDALRDRSGPNRRLVHLKLDRPDVSVFPGVPVRVAGDTEGYLTSADYGYSVGHGLAAGLLDAEVADPGTGVTIAYEGDTYDATVVEAPMFDSENERLRG